MNKSRRQRKSSNWSERQNRDQYVRKARTAGFRARAVFKLEQIDQKYRLIRPDTRLVDLGSAPGSWSQYAVRKVKIPEQVIAVDLLPMDDLSGVNFIRGDFTDPAVVDQVKACLGERPVDLVLSDMAPNITGIRATDQARAELIQEAVLRFCNDALRPGGALLTKLFEGEATVVMRNQIKVLFDHFQAIKPDASRSASKEFYILARGYRADQRKSGG